MKKYFLLTLAVAMMVALPVNAQFKFGLKAGVNLANVSFNEEELAKNVNPDNYTGFQVGPMVEFTVPILGIGFDAALLYSQTGFNVPNEETVKSGYFLIPVNLKYKVALPVIKPYLTAGPYIGLNLFGDDKEFSANSAIKKIESESFAAGLNFGLGVELFSKLQIGANYQLGLTDDYKSYKPDPVNTAKTIAFGQKSSVWSITAALFF